MAEKIERKYMAHMIDTANLCVTTETTSSWYWLGDDLDDYSIEMNAEVEIERDILGNEYVIHDNYDLESNSDMFYARSGDAMFTKLQRIIDNLYTGKRCTTNALEVHMWGNPTWGGITGLTSTYNPKELGLYEKVNNVYVPSEDTSADTSKTYYYQQYTAIKRRCYIVPTSYGGDTSGYQIPFTVRYFNDPNYPVQAGKYDTSFKAFTPNN